MIREKIDAKQEREIIAYSIINTDYLKAIMPMCKPELFRSNYARIVFSWVSTYFKRYGDAPGRDIQDIYITHKLELDEDEQVIATFLQSLSDAYDEKIPNIAFAVDTAKLWFTGRGLELLNEELRESLANKDYQGAEAAIAGYKRIEQIQTESIDVISDHESMIEAFTDENEKLFQFPGALGAVCGPFCRSDFVVFLAPPKRGKSWWLWESAKHALYKGNNVLFISLEMKRYQMLRRMWMGLTRRPRSTKTVKIPTFVEMDDSTDEHPVYTIFTEEKEIESIPLDNDFFREWTRRYKKYFRGGSLKLKCIPAKTATVKDIETLVANLSYYDGWEPDVIVIDYPDLLLSTASREERHQLNDIYVNLRGFAAKKDNCIIGASQANRVSMDADLTMASAAEDIRKVAHATKILGINATNEEKSNGIYRISQLGERDEEAVFEQAYVTSCLSLGSPFLDSRYRSQVWTDKGKKK